MRSTNFSGRQVFLRKTARSALEGALVVLAGTLLVRWRLAEELFKPALIGCVAAWAVSTASVAALLALRGKSFKVFLWAFGGGAFLRAAVLVLLMAAGWRERYDVQAAMLGAYAAGILVLLCTEYRQLSGKQQ